MSGVNANPSRGSLPPVTNVVIAGLGGQGVLKASDVLSDALLRAGHDVKKSEVHGMAQRGGSVQSDVRFGERVYSPMVMPGEAHYLVVFATDQVEAHRHLLRPDGVLITPELIEAEALPSRRSLNVALIGALSATLLLDDACWMAALRSSFGSRGATGEVFEANRQAFLLGRRLAVQPSSTNP